MAKETDAIHFPWNVDVNVIKVFFPIFKYTLFLILIFFFLLFGYCTLLVPGKTESWRGAKGRAFETTSLTQDSDKSMTCHGLRKSWMNSQWFKSTCANCCAHLLLRFKLKCFVLYWLWAKGIHTASHQSSYAVNC